MASSDDNYCIIISRLLSERREFAERNSTTRRKVNQFLNVSLCLARIKYHRRISVIICIHYPGRFFKLSIERLIKLGSLIAKVSVSEDTKEFVRRWCNFSTLIINGHLSINAFDEQKKNRDNWKFTGYALKKNYSSVLKHASTYDAAVWKRIGTQMNTVQTDQRVNTHVQPNIVITCSRVYRMFI